MDLEQRVRQLEDDREIRDLKARYLRACDLKQPDAVRDTMLPDVKVDFEGFPPLNDRESFVGVYTEFGCVPEMFDIHHSGDGIITFNGTDEATGQWTLTFHNVNLQHRTMTRFGVQYEDRYVRKDGRWWIAETKSWRTYAVVEQVDEEGNVKVVALGKGPESFTDN